MAPYSQEGKRVKSNEAKPICMFLSGDVMTRRGIDQVLPHPAVPALYEPFVRDARDYVQLAESAHGLIPRPVDFAYF
jgi:poly-gamma-glutamate synthesis protein (capsule biosynthesis protein)